MEEVKLIDRKNVTQLPLKLNLGDKTFYLVKKSDEWKLLSSVCPHMGGKAVIDDDCFKCPLHGWEFDLETGECLNATNEELTSYNVKEEGDQLVGIIPEKILRRSVKREDKKSVDVNLDITLHTHSSLELTYKDFSLLTDPWIDGPAFMGSWLHYPKPLIDAKDLTPDAIWISHEHSDHFHIPTLKKLNKNIPVYFPDFPNRRIEKRLREIGFHNVTPMPFGETFELTNNIKLTCFEPASLWNDSIVLMEFDDFKFLNINDAGLNDRIAEIVYPVDLVASAFTWGASGYPLTWEHVSQEEKIEVMRNSNEGMLEMLKSSVDLYGADYVLPYAGHFTLWHPDHMDYLDISIKNTIDDVVEYIDRAEVIDILPGEKFSVSSKKYNRIYKRRDRLFEKSTVKKHAQKHFEKLDFQNYYPEETNLTRNEIQEYFLKFNHTNPIEFCENICFKLEVYHQDHTKTLFFEINDGFISPCQEDEIDLKIGLPSEILRAIIEHNISWDEAHIGYWCDLNRSPDVYHPNFWRMLQAPYFRKESVVNKRGSDHGVEIGKNTSIDKVLENFGVEADRILRRYGLFCVGCQRANQETILQGAKTHGLNDKKLNRLIRELNNLN